MTSYSKATPYRSHGQADLMASAVNIENLSCILAGRAERAVQTARAHSETDDGFVLTDSGGEMNPADYARMAQECSRQADAMPPSPERDALMEKARQ